MAGISIWQLLILSIPLFAVFLLPLLLTFLSKRAQGAPKLGWCILVVFTSWIGYAIFLIASPNLDSAGQRQVS